MNWQQHFLWGGSGVWETIPIIGIYQACSLRPRSGDMVPLGFYATRNFWGHPSRAQRTLGMYPFIDVAMGNQG